MLNANSVDPDQRPSSAASDLGRLIWSTFCICPPLGSQALVWNGVSYISLTFNDAQHEKRVVIPYDVHITKKALI